MRRALFLALLTGFAAWLSVAHTARAAPVLVDDFRDVSAWSAHPADGVEMGLSGEEGALRVDFDFKRGAGYAVIRREVDLRLPEHYAFAFRIRGEAPSNNLEFKLVDSTGTNVWWWNQRDFVFPKGWRTETIKRRQIQFAWGPAGGGEIRHVKAIELAITAGSGGRGTVWLDDLELRELSPPSAAAPPVASASSAQRGREPVLALDGIPSTAWASRPGDRRPWIELDLGGDREFGGLVLDWVRGRHPHDYVVEIDQGGAAWRPLRVVEGTNGGRDHLYLPESEARRIRVRATSSVGRDVVALASIAVKSLDWAPNVTAFFQQVAKDVPRGSFPRGFSEQSYWTVVGVEGANEEALVSEDGAIEPHKGGFSIEPFLFYRGRLWTWNDVEKELWLAEGYLPIPSVRWRADSVELTVTAHAWGGEASPQIEIGYAMRNRGTQSENVTLYLALRPFQVNPPSQSLNTPGGAATIRALRREERFVGVDRDRQVITLTEPDGFGAATFDQGDVTEYLRNDRLPPAHEVESSFGFVSGALAYRLELEPAEERTIGLRVPQHVVQSESADLQRQLMESRLAWKQAQEKVSFHLPPVGAEILRTLRAQIAYILINRDGPAIQPGARSYERSWIRDGSLTSSALLRLGHQEVVRDYIDWFATHQYENGKVPCCVDRRGPDPVPEHDSHGELIYLIAEYLRYSGDKASVERWWVHALQAANYLDSLRQQRRTPAYRTRANRHFFGLLPPSISHEGYSAKPMHSYWDDLFALRGFKDAAYLARSLGHHAEATRLARMRAEFERDLHASVRAAMARHRIDFIPGAADLGDFDATSTTIALSPVQADRALPQPALRRTFERYWDFFDDRRRQNDWDAYTPYELRHVGAFIRLGWRERAHELLGFFMSHRRPQGWAQWAEVVGREERKPRFIGDMPHTWVGSDYIRSVLDMFAFDRESDRALVIGAGIPASWLEREGVVVRGLKTTVGPLDLVMRRDGRAIEVRVDRVSVPAGGLVIAPPGVTSRWRASVNGQRASIGPMGSVRIRKVPATVLLEPPRL
jgi:hypothetical protein